MPTARARGLFRLTVTAALLVVVFRWVDVSTVVSRLTTMDPAWVIPALLVSVAQIGVSAWRWRYTAARLGIELPFASAVREYYLATFLNQVLPGGVVGDVSRAWRHSQAHPDATGPVVRAVVLERASGQIVMTTVACVSVASLLVTSGVSPTVAVGVVILAIVSAGSALVHLRRRPAGATTVVGRWWRDTQIALLGPEAFGMQVSTSLVVVSTYLLTFLLTARAVGIDTSWLILLPLVAPVLVAMLLPVTVAGWGVREAAAAALWGAVGLTAVDGVTVSIGYGLVVLLGSLPGGAILLRR